MKASSFTYYILFFVIVAVAVSCYFYPVTRDEFYYLHTANVPNPFQEYYNSYFKGNPRIGEFFCNIISRNRFLEVVFGVALFVGFFTMLFINIYRRFPDVKSNKYVGKFLLLTAFFVFLINYFGEMFYYTPFSTNYTFTHIFYLLFLYFFIEYYVYENESVTGKINYFILMIFGVFVGMCNEHIPPVLLAMLFLGAVFYLVKNKKLPNFKMILLPIFILAGYAILFFAPANTVKQKTVGKSVFDIGFSSYIGNFFKILKTYLYYNAELVIFSAIIIGVVTVLILRKKIYLSKLLKNELLVYVLFAILPFFIVSISPLSGTRLLFFTNTVLIIILYKFSQLILEYFGFKKPLSLAYIFLVCFFAMSVIFTYRGRDNYEEVSTKIMEEKAKSSDVILEKGFDYSTTNSVYLNKKIFLESGKNYIDSNVEDDNSTEKNLKKYYQLNSIGVK